MAGTTGLEPATSAVTGQRSNQTELRPQECLQHPWMSHKIKRFAAGALFARFYLSLLRCKFLPFPAHPIDTQTVAATTKSSLPDERPFRWHVHRTQHQRPVAFRDFSSASFRHPLIRPNLFCRLLLCSPSPALCLSDPLPRSRLSRLLRHLFPASANFFPPAPSSIGYAGVTDDTNKFADAEGRKRRGTRGILISRPAHQRSRVSFSGQCACYN